MKEIALDKAYRLVNHGPLILVSTRSKDGKYNIAPIAWNCPVKKDPPTILAAIGKSHKTYTNIKETGEFVICVPSAKQASLASDTGSVSGTEMDKFKEFNISTFRAKDVDCLVPEGLVGAIECRYEKEYDAGVALIIGRAVRAYGAEDGFSDRVYPEHPDGRTLHHLGGGSFGVISENIVET